MGAKDTGNIWVVIPAFNEERVIGDVIESVHAHFSKIVVVDDGSTDGTPLRIPPYAAICRHLINLGQGAALRTGMDYALRHGAEYIVTFDADGQHDPADARRMVEMLAGGDYDIVLGSRFLETPRQMPRSRYFLLKLATLFTRLTTGLAVTDAHNGLRVLSGDAARKIRFHQNGFAHASEIMSEVAALDLRYAECPCLVRYTAYSRQKGQRWTGAFRILADLGITRLYRR